MNGTNKQSSLIEFTNALNRHHIPITQKTINRFLEHKAREKRIPLIGLFELTSYCNLDCKMCYVHLDNIEHNPKGQLSVKTWKGLMADAYEAGMRQAKLSGGECLTHPGFDELYLFLEEKKTKINIASNGLLMDKNRIDFFLKHRPSSIQISLYGSSNSSYQIVTGHRCFDEIYRNLEMLKDAKLPVSIAITPSQYNKKDIEDILLVAKSLNIPHRVNSLLLATRDSIEQRPNDLSVDEYIEIYKKWNKINDKELNSILPEELPEENHGGAARYGLQCGAGRSSFAILYNGKMCPCVSLSELSADPLESGFNEAWKRIVALSDNYQIPRECGACVYRKDCLICAAAHKYAPAGGHCDPRVCEYTKKLVSAGIIERPTVEGC